MSTPKGAALVTGGARRIGAAIATRTGAGRLRRRASLPDLHGVGGTHRQREIQGLGRRVPAVPLRPQRSSRRRPPSSPDGAGEHFSHLDVLINNASIFERGHPPGNQPRPVRAPFQHQLQGAFLSDPGVCRRLRPRPDHQHPGHACQPVRPEPRRLHAVEKSASRSHEDGRARARTRHPGQRGVPGHDTATAGRSGGRPRAAERRPALETHRQHG